MGLRPDDFTVPHADIREEVGLLEPPAVSIQLPPIPFEGKSADGDVLGSLDSVDDEPPRGSRAGFEGEVSAVRPEGQPADLVVRPAGDAISDHDLGLSVVSPVRDALPVGTEHRIPDLLVAGVLLYRRALDNRVRGRPTPCGIGETAVRAEPERPDAVVQRPFLAIDDYEELTNPLDLERESLAIRAERRIPEALGRNQRYHRAVHDGCQLLSLPGDVCDSLAVRAEDRIRSNLPVDLLLGSVGDQFPERPRLGPLLVD